MSRRRYLSTDAGRDKALRDVARQSMFAHSFYLLAIPCAADDCTLPTNDPDELLWEVWPSMARDYTTEDVAAAIELLTANRLWEYAPDGRLRYPPGSYYKHQTYIREDRRGAAKAPRSALEPAHVAPSIEGIAQNTAEQRTSAQNVASFSFSSSVSSSPPPVPTEPTGVAPGAASAAPVALVPVPVALSPPGEIVPPGRKLSPDDLARYRRIWDALTTKNGPASTDPAKRRRGAAVQQLLQAHYDGPDIGRCLELWPQAMPSGTRPTDTGVVSNIDRILNQDEGPPTVKREIVQRLHQNGQAPRDDMAAVMALRARKAH